MNPSISVRIETQIWICVSSVKIHQTLSAFFDITLRVLNISYTFLFLIHKFKFRGRWFVQESLLTSLSPLYHDLYTLSQLMLMKANLNRIVT